MRPLPPAFASPEDFLAAIEEDIGGLVSYVDSEERIRFASRELLQYFGRPRDQVLGRTLRELHGDENYARFCHHMMRGLSGKEVHYERESIDAQGRPALI